MMSTVTAKPAKKAVLRNMYSHLCLMPIKHRDKPLTMSTTPATPSAGVILGVSGNSSGRAVAVGTRLADRLDD